MQTKKQMCDVCNKMLKQGIVTKKGKKFCSDVCAKKYAKKVCEFC